MNRKVSIIIALLMSFLSTFILTTFLFKDKNNPKSFHVNNFYQFFKRIYKTVSFKKISPTPSIMANKQKIVFITPSLAIQSPTPTILITKKITPTKTIILPTKIPTPTITPKKPSPSPTNETIAKEKLSNSKLGVFILINLSNGAKKIINSAPRIIKFIDPQGNQEMLSIVKNYKQKYPQGTTVLRFWNRTSGIYYNTNNNPETSAQDFFNRVHQPAFQEMGKNLQYFDYLQNPNEFENTPEWQGEEKIRWNGRFWLKLTQLNNNFGVKTCIGGIPVGNIEANELSYILEELKQMKNLGAAFCYHGYTFNYSTNVNEEIYFSLRYRQFYDFFKQNAPELTSMPLILSEGGVAENGDPKAGYLISNSIERYKNWLLWYDNEIKKDPYLIGVTLFQIGNNSDWGYFDLEPISDWLAYYINSQSE